MMLPRLKSSCGNDNILAVVFRSHPKSLLPTCSLLPSSPPHRRPLMVPSPLRETVRTSSRVTGVAGGNVQTKSPDCTYGSPIFKAVQEKHSQASYTPLRGSPKSPKCAVGEDAEQSHVDTSEAAPH